MKSVGIGLLGRDEGLLEGPKIWWGTKKVVIESHLKQKVILLQIMDQKLEVASGPQQARFAKNVKKPQIDVIVIGMGYQNGTIVICWLRYLEFGMQKS